MRNFFLKFGGFVKVLSNKGKASPVPVAMNLSEMLSGSTSISIFAAEGNVTVFCRGFCVCTYSAKDTFSRNYCLVQLFNSGNFSLRYLADVFYLSYNHCSRIVSLFKKYGLDGLREETLNRNFNRRVISEDVAEFILSERSRGTTYERISSKIRFRWSKKISARSICNWVSKGLPSKSNLALVPQQIELDVGQEIDFSSEYNVWQSNVYAGSMILYGILDRTGLLKSFCDNIFEDNIRRFSNSGVRRVVLTLFFLHALRFKSIEQSKFLIEKDFCLTIGGGFLRGQSLRYAIDEIVKNERFDLALASFHKELLFLTEKRNRVFYTDGHFSNYYGKNSVPMGYDSKRQVGAMGRTAVYLHNTDGEVMFFFESATNTTLSNDIETLVTRLQALDVKLKRKTFFFDRGGYSKKCFCFLASNKMYFVTYLKNRKKERCIAESEFVIRIFFVAGEKYTYSIHEGARRWFKSGLVRVIVFIGNDGSQIPVVTNNPFLRAETIIYYLQKRWCEENSFKYMIEHFGIDSLTSYKIEEAPDKVILKANPERVKQNKMISEKKLALQKLQSEFASKIIDDEIFPENCTSKTYTQEQQAIKLKIKTLKIEIEKLKSEREKIKPKIEVNLKDANVIMSQKRRLLINSIKALNYNSEKWLQKIFMKFHAKEDETLALIQSLLKHPGKVRFNETLVEVVLEPIHVKALRKTVEAVLEGLAQSGSLRLPDSRILRLKLTQ